jgi:GTP pyrophosphokinase
MERKSVAFEQLSDIFGFRVIVNDSTIAIGRSASSTHLAHGARAATRTTSPRPSRTTTLDPHHGDRPGQPAGGAADPHPGHGRGGGIRHRGPRPLQGGHQQQSRLANESRAYQWLRRTIDLLAEADNPEEFWSTPSSSSFHDQVFCSRQGRLIACPGAARPSTSAYAVHTDVGNTAVAPSQRPHGLRSFTELQNGERSRSCCARAKHHRLAWESLVVTGKARAAIRRAARASTRRQYAGLGRQILERAFARAGKAFSDEKLRGALPRLARASTDDVLAAVGRGEMFSGDVVRGVYPDYVERRPDGRDERASVVRADGSGANGSALPIRGIEPELAIRFAPDGGAVPGDRIVGILTPGVGVTIYPIQSRALADFENDPESWIDVRWDVEAGSGRRFPARLALQSINEPGSLAQIAQVIADHDGNIENVSMRRRTPDFTEVTVDLSVFDLKHLNAIVSELRAKPAVSKVERVTG